MTHCGAVEVPVPDLASDRDRALEIELFTAALLGRSVLGVVTQARAEDGDDGLDGTGFHGGSLANGDGDAAVEKGVEAPERNSRRPWNTPRRYQAHNLALGSSHVTPA